MFSVVDVFLSMMSGDRFLIEVMCLYVKKVVEFMKEVVEFGV